MKKERGESKRRAGTPVGRSDTTQQTLLFSILDATDDGILVVDLEGNVLYSNTRFLRMWNIPDEISENGNDRDLLDFVSDQLADPGAFLTRVAGIYRTQSEVLDKFRFKDGRVFERFSRPFMDKGAHKGRIWSFRDVTVRERATEALTASEERWRTIISNSQAIIFMTDADGVFLVSEGEGLAALGLKPGEVVGRNAFEMYADFPEITSGLDGALRGETVRELIEVNSVHFDIWFSPHRDTSGEIVGILGMAVDITESMKADARIRENERFLETLLSSIQDGITVLNPDMTVRRVNAVMREWYGDILPLEGKKCHEVYHNRDEPCDSCPSLRCLKSGKTERGVIPGMANSPVEWLEMFSYPIQEESGEITGVVEFVRDITERKRAEREHQKLQERVQHVQKLESLGILAGGIAHDFNNLLMAILGNADLALEDLPSGSPVAARLTEIEKASRRAADLCQQMLAYSGRGRFVIEAVDISELVREMSHILEITVSKNVALKYEFAAELPRVEADPTQVRQIVMNLITNASEAIGEGDGVISIMTGSMHCDREYLKSSYIDEDLSDGDYVYIEVADSGCGMDNLTRSRLFDPFFTTKFTGRGLGLSAVLGIMRGHGGAIRISTEVGRGTTFRVLFPVLGPISPSRLEPGSKPRELKRSGTVLIADDDPSILRVTRSMLEKLGLDVLHAQNGIEAISLYENTEARPVCSIIDLTMPGMNGEQVFTELRRIDPQARIIITSGYDEHDVSRKFTGRGLAGFIQKPYKLADLTDLLDRVLGPYGPSEE